MRPIVFGLTLAALLFVMSQVPRDSRAHNDGDLGPHGTGGTHYMHCGDDDGHHARWPYADYSENWLDIKNWYTPGLPADYISAFGWGQVNWNATNTRVRLYGSFSQQPNWWSTFQDPNTNTVGLTIAACNHIGSLHPIQATFAALNTAPILLNAPEALQRWAAAHEIGHQQGLHHSMQIVEYPVAMMYYTATSPPYQSPQPDDVCGVNSMYRSNTYPVSVPPCHSNHSISP